MTLESWSLAGFQIISDDDLLCLPIFEKSVGRRAHYFVQYTFSSASNYFELTEISIDESFIRKLPAPANPRDILYFGLLRNGDPELIEKRNLSKALSSFNRDQLSDSARIQLDELSRAVLAPSGARVPVSRNDSSFWATLSSQEFIDQAISRVSQSKPFDLTIRRILWCSRWVTDWRLDGVPSEHLEPLLEDLTIGRHELQEELLKAKAGDSLRFEPTDRSVQTGQVSQTLKKIEGLKRQELRLSGLLKYLLEQPRLGRAVVLQYLPKTKYEHIVLPMIQQIAYQNLDATAKQRELRVAQLIPKIYVKYFPIRRGRFLVDFLRDLSDYPQVREQLIDIYQRKRGTYGVGLYRTILDDLTGS